jgi:hypothetical protein
VLSELKVESDTAMLRAMILMLRVRAGPVCDLCASSRIVLVSLSRGSLIEVDTEPMSGIKDFAGQRDALASSSLNTPMTNS